VRRFAKKNTNTDVRWSPGERTSSTLRPILFIYIQEIRGERQTFENERRRVSAHDKRGLGFRVRVSSVMASADGKVVEEERVEDDVVEIKEKPLDIMRYMDAVRDSSVGAIATFSGTTRDTFEGQEVLELRYEAYETMAYRELRRICQAARERWELKRMAVAHRTGVVPIGQESVFIAVSSIHRQDALKACQFVIDEIKASVPIWKKEVYNNGESWKQNSEFLTRNTT